MKVKAPEAFYKIEETLAKIKEKHLTVQRYLTIITETRKFLNEQFHTDDDNPQTMTQTNLHNRLKAAHEVLLRISHRLLNCQRLLAKIAKIAQ